MLPVLALEAVVASLAVLLPVSAATPTTPPVPQPVVAIPSAAPRWAPPLPDPVVVRGFDPPARRWLPGHRGVDLDAEAGDVVSAAGAGTVTWAGPLAGRGVVVVRHPDGRRTTYEPVDALVRVGQRVGTGDPLGRIAVGSTHCGGVPSCLHWGLRIGEDYLDPMLLLRRGRPVLLPSGRGPAVSPRATR